MHGVLRSRVRGALPILVIAGVSLFVTGTLVLGPLTAQSSNPIPAENQLAGNPQSEWDVSGSGDATIQGFATDISVNKGSTISFKVTTPASVTFNMNIYRLGYYQGNGARRVAQLTGFAGRVQPACLTDSTTGLYDCGNWTVNATWNVPATAVSGIYVAKDNATAIYDGVRQAYADMNASGAAVFWITTPSGFSIDRNPVDSGFPWVSVWQGIYEVNQTYNGATINIDVDVAAMSSPSSPQ